MISKYTYQLVVFIVIFYFLSSTRWREMSHGLAPQLATNAINGGIPQAPGHSLLMILLRLWMKLRETANISISIVEWCSYFNVLLSSFSLTALFVICEKVADPVSAMFSVFTCFCGTTVWKYSSFLNEHGLDNLLFTMTILCYILSKENETYYFLTFMFGIMMMTNKYQFISATIILFFKFYQGFAGSKNVLEVFQYCMFGLLPLLYIQYSVRYSNSVSTYFGSVELSDMSEFVSQDKVMDSFANFETKDFSMILETFEHQWAFFLSQFGLYFTSVGLFGCLLALIQSNCRIIPILFLLLSTFLAVFCPINTAIHTQIERIEQRWLLVLFCLTVGLSKGIQFGSKVLKFIFAKLGIDLEKFHTMFIVVIVGYFAQRMQSLVPARQRSNDILKSVSLSYLNSMPKDSIILVSGMEISDSFMYYNQVDGTRTDLSVLNIESATQKWFHRRHKLFKDVKFAGMRFSNNTNLPSEFSINDFAKSNNHRPIMLMPHTLTVGAIDETKYSMEPWGLFYRIYYKGEEQAFDDDYKERMRTYLKKTSKFQYAYADKILAKTALENEVIFNYWKTKGSVATHPIMLAEKFKSENKMKTYVRYLKQATEVFEVLFEQLTKEYEDKYPEDPLMAIPPYYFEQSARCFMNLAEQDTINDIKINRYMKAWDMYERYLKYSEIHKEGYFTKEVRIKIQGLLGHFEKEIGQEKRQKIRAKIWKKSI